jgi:hypothetical protein
LEVRSELTEGEVQAAWLRTFSKRRFSLANASMCGLVAREYP